MIKIKIKNIKVILNNRKIEVIKIYDFDDRKVYEVFSIFGNFREGIVSYK